MPHLEIGDRFGENHVMSAADRLIVALDVPDREAALAIVSALRPRVRRFKIGLELYTACGPDLIREIQDGGDPQDAWSRELDLRERLSQAIVDCTDRATTSEPFLGANRMANGRFPWGGTDSRARAEWSASRPSRHNAAQSGFR